jgi:four helix bundle protein
VISHFTELTVYERSFELAGEIFLLSKRWPAEERYSLTDQIRRASRSVGANLAESWGKRRYEAHFVNKLTDADGENHEVEHWLRSAHRDGYLSDSEQAELLALKRAVGRMLGTLIANPHPFLLSRNRSERSSRI